MKEIVPGIYQIQLTLPHFSPDKVNLYLIKGASEYLLVDAGWEIDTIEADLIKQLAEIDITPHDINRLVITHCHIDHYSLSGRLQHNYGIKVYAHKSDVEIVKDRIERHESFTKNAIHVMLENGVPPAEILEPYPPLPQVKQSVQPDILLEGGENITIGDFSFTVLWTPGHSPGHICLYEPKQKLLLSGDVVLPTIIGNIGIDLRDSVNALGDYLKTLDTLKQLDVKQVFPGHESVFSNLNERIEQIVIHHHSRIEKVYQLITGASPQTAYAVAIAMLNSGESGENGWSKLKGWGRLWSLLDIRACLQYLRFQNRLKAFAKGGIIYYQSTAY